MSPLTDQWTAPATYEHFMGRWSRMLARVFLQWLRPAARAHWLELGCGTGALTSAILAKTEPASVTACDPAANFIEYARRNLPIERASFVIAGAADFPMRASGYDVATSLLALNFFPDPAAALARMGSATVPGGSVSACVWDYAGEMQFLRYFWDAAVEVDPEAARLDEAVRFPMCTPAALTRLFEAAGLSSVRCDPLEIVTEFASMDDYWTPLLGGTGPAPSFVASLDETQRADLRGLIAARLPHLSSGAIWLRARAWAIQGCTEAAR